MQLGAINGQPGVRTGLEPLIDSLDQSLRQHENEVDNVLQRTRAIWTQHQVGQVQFIPLIRGGPDDDMLELTRYAWHPDGDDNGAPWDPELDGLDSDDDGEEDDEGDGEEEEGSVRRRRRRRSESGSPNGDGRRQRRRLGEGGEGVGGIGDRGGGNGDDDGDHILGVNGKSVNIARVCD